ncbi:MAG: ribulose-phosphate 3-epimerase [Christensenellales bacterium]|jgi:ribulose-phosphate 3-epimerase
MLLLPSIASADPLKIGEALEALGDWPYVHIDIEDGHFVPNITFGLKTLCAIAQKCPDRMLDVHLMTDDPCSYLEALARAGIAAVSAQIEALRYPMVFIHSAKNLGMKARLALNIGTDIRAAQPFLPIADGLLLMTAEPDARGEKLYAPALERAVDVCLRFADTKVYVDGALDDDALTRLKEAGCAGAVLGRRVFAQGNPFSNLKQLQNRLATTQD